MCDFSGKLIAWLDHELPAEKAAEVERHLADCSECRSGVDAYKRVSGEFDAYCEETLASSERRKASPWTAVAAAAGAAAALAALFLVWSRPRVQRPVPFRSPAAVTASQPAIEHAALETAPPASRIHRRQAKPVRIQSVKSAPGPRQTAYLLPEEPMIQIAFPADEMFPEVQKEAQLEIFHDLLHRYRASLPTDRRHLIEQYQFTDLARKVVGVGSVGTRVWILLLHGPSPDDVLFLQAKEAEASVLERFTKKSQYANHGARVVAGQRLMQASSDIFLGWQRTEGLDGRPHDYYVRQLQDWKGSVDTDNVIPAGMKAYGELCAHTLARAHARSGDRIAIAAYLGNNSTFEKALAKFAESYADQNERDYEAFAAACKSGRLHAEEGL